MKRLPWTLYRYLGKELILAFLLSLLFLSLLLMIVSSFQAVSEGFTLRIILPWVFDSAGYFAFYTVPISLLVASTLVYGRFVGEREYTATAASGILPLHVFAPIGALALLLTGVAMLAQGTVFPDASYKKRNIQRYLVKQLEHLGEGYQRKLPIERGRLYCAEHHGTLLKGLQITKYIPAAHKGDELPSLDKDRDNLNERLVPIDFYAKEGRVSIDKERELLVLHLTDVNVLAPHPDARLAFQHGQYDFREGSERVQAKTLEIEFPIEQKSPRVPDRMTSDLEQEYKTTVERGRACGEALARAATDADRDRIKGEIVELTRLERKLMIEIWRRRSLALSCFTFAFLGFPISITLRQRHRLQSFFIGVLLVLLVFYPSMLVGDDLVHLGLLPAGLAMTLGNIVLSSIALLLTVRLLWR